MGKFNKPANVLVLDLINSVNVVPGTTTPLALQPGEVVYGTPAEVQGEPNWDTSLLCTATNLSSYDGSVTVFYNRLDATTLFKNIRVNLDVQGATTTADLLDRLNARYGLLVAADDIVPSPVDPLTAENPSVSATIVFADTGLVYTGSLVVSVGPDDAVGERLNTVVTQTVLDGLHYPDDDTTKGQAYLYSYGVDCSGIKTYLQTLTTGGPIVVADIVRELNKVVYDEWVDSATAADYNLHGVTVRYAGVTTDSAAALADSAYSHVAILTLDDALCANFAGDLYMHYNA